MCLRNKHGADCQGEARGFLGDIGRVGSNVISWGVLQEGFGGTACETCADDNLFGPNCTGGMSDFCVTKCIWKDWKSNS